MSLTCRADDNSERRLNLHKAAFAKRLSSAPVQQEMHKTAQPDFKAEGKVFSVLLVDDVEDNRKLFSLYTKKLGLQCVTASSGTAALEMLSAETFDLILLDLQMPQMNGYSTLEELRRRGIQTPVLALTAHAFTHEKKRCLEAGFDGFISKPVSLEKFKEIIKEFLCSIA